MMSSTEQLIIEKLDTLHDDVRDLREDVKLLRKHVVDGNGVPGLIVRVAVLEEKERAGGLSRKARYGIITGVVGFIFSLITSFGPGLLSACHGGDSQLAPSSSQTTHGNSDSFRGMTPRP
jgi:hypothetical protein